MGIRSSYQLDSEIFDKTTRPQEFEAFVGRQAKDFKVLTKQRLIDEPHSGEIYARPGGKDFQRRHKTSARGERPAIDKGNLLNSIDDVQLSPTEAHVIVTAERDGFDYPGFLQEYLDRPTVRETDVEEADTKMLNDANEFIRDLL